VEDVLAFLTQQIALAHRAGIANDAIIVDPGFGFGKTVAHNTTLLQHLDKVVQGVTCPVLVGLSRKSFLTLPQQEVSDKDTSITPTIAPVNREALTAAAHAIAFTKGATLFRIHCWKTQAPVFGLLQA
jgi:dihydropteroate synthase